MATRALPCTLLASSLGLGGCSSLFGEPPAYTFELVIRALSDDGSPVAGAEATIDGMTPVSTDASGSANVRVVGHEGDRRSVTLHCPGDYVSPAKPLLLSLHRGSDTAPIYEGTCTPLARQVVVAVRLDQGAHLPVYYLGQRVAVTDESGAAHFLVRIPQGEPFRVSVSTAAEPDLLPVDPQMDFSVGAADDIVVFEQKFTRIEPPPPPPPPAPRRPTHL